MDHEPCIHCPLKHAPRNPPIPPLPIHLFSMNSVPLESEASDIRRTIRQGLGHARLSYLEDELESLHNAILAIRKEYDALQHQIAEASTVLSTLRRFPPEIWREIFCLTLPSDISPTMRPLLTQSPWNISRVCSRWRAVTFAFPELWSQIGVKGVTYPTDALKTQLERSHPRPLTLSATQLDMESFRLLLDSSARWECAHLFLNNAMLPALNESLGCFPQLRQLVATTFSTDTPCRAFETAPELIDVTSHGGPSRLPLPFSQLTRLRLRIPHSPDGLRLARNLVHLTLMRSSREQPPPRYHPPIELPQLRMLMLQDGRFLESLVLLVLEDIYISRDASSLPPFVSRSSCRLKKLTIIENEADIIPVVNCVPTILEIRLRDFTNIAVLLTYLTIPPEITDPHTWSICPNIRRLSLCSMKAKDDSLLVQMVKSRKKTSPIFISLLAPESSLDHAYLTSTTAAMLAPRSNSDHSDVKSDVERLVDPSAIKERFLLWESVYPGRGR
ncbi:hypothetical protein FB451DRAFT_1301065 [Mycena latifolia]|nr:hypothetical protein FB451DRAFT_1301065 [Mycena latifolia]